MDIPANSCGCGLLPQNGHSQQVSSSSLAAVLATIPTLCVDILGELQYLG